MRRETYGSVGGRELLLIRGDDSAAALSGVQCALALNNGFTGSCGTTAGAAANLGNGVPVVRHFVCVGELWTRVSCEKAE